MDTRTDDHGLCGDVRQEGGGGHDDDLLLGEEIYNLKHTTSRTFMSKMTGNNYNYGGGWENQGHGANL